jgi:phosphatidylglycerophosphate synthase
LGARLTLISQKYSFDDVEKCLQRKSWWAIVFVLPFARRLALFLTNRTKITPNQVTLGAFVLVLPAIFFYAQGSYWATVLAVSLFEINYLFDCVDGTMARLRKISSPFGGYLDAILDRVRIFFMCLAIGYGYWCSDHSVEIVFWLLLYLGVNNLIIISMGYQERTLAKAGFSSRLGAELISDGRRTLLNRWFHYAGKRNLMPYYHDVELDALVFVVGPLIKQPLAAIQFAVIAGTLLFFAQNVIFSVNLLRHSSLESN